MSGSSSALQFAGVLACATLLASTTACKEGEGQDIDVTADSLPGGEVGADYLTEQGLLNDAGVIGLGPAAPEEQKTQLALCDYVFGSADQVAEVAGLNPSVTLNPESGWVVLGGNGARLNCGYGTRPQPDLALVVSEEDPGIEPGGYKSVVEVQVEGRYGALVYFDRYRGEVMSPDLARTWLRQAVPRIEQGI